MLCHKCPHQAEIDRLREICSSCSDREIEKPNGSSLGTAIHIGAMKHPDDFCNTTYHARADVRGSDEKLTPLPEEVETRILDELEAFMRLSFINQILLVWILRGESLSEFARLDWVPRSGKADENLTRQAIRCRVESIKNRCPTLAEVVQKMVRLNSVNRKKREGKICTK